MPSFKFDSASCFLTYPQTDLSWQDIITHLSSLGDIDWARVCYEQHQDGSPHRHVVCKWNKRVQSRNPRLFDIQGRHPNIQGVRSIKHAIKYVSKDGEFFDVGTVPVEESSNIDWLASAATLSEAEYYKLACQHRLSFQYAQKFWQLGCKQTCEIPSTYEADLTRESEALLLTPLPEGTTVLVGNTGIGKTSWAKRVCPKPALWVRHIDVLRSFRPGYHKSIIFDDMSFMHLPREAQIHIVDQSDEAHIHCRYGHAVIPAKTVKIFTANAYPFTRDPAIERRVNLIVL